MALNQRLEIDQAALDDLINGPVGQRLLSAFADRVRNQARKNARPISSRLASALWTGDPMRDETSAYVDVGYNKAQPGWVLWFHEVGTRRHGARPHLRPALAAIAGSDNSPAAPAS